MTPEQMEQMINDMKKENSSLNERLRILENTLNNARVVIKNLEGAFKVLTNVPTTNDAQDGSIFLVDSGGTYSLYARISNGWRSVTLT